ncbi:chemotaxis response regulator protein-glutamate methylesterase [Vibrio sp. 05-20-BW147]|uniref:protein-glutamate methylesterase/protein-glutamine glutaminase n=1 Tax=Vibrio sp. 05-20-BW147 TaxID=2575834 RepID=UPI001592F389|nr:chemotaxis response regulator protein-glutamate methylesterase [Vibrio sp. 05-20-BW147]NVC61814.1 chemotaxis response regulator protein-glutamate methylesterase [Vibrio sp. 05-20-BW147]
MNKIKVFIVDDSAVIRQVLGEIINADPNLSVVGVAPDPLLAMRKMSKNWPDVVLLDISMPKMDGISFLKEIMTTRPTPVVICSALTEAAPQLTLEALSSGAIEVINKPQARLIDYLHSPEAKQILNTLKEAAKTKVKSLKYLAENNYRTKHSPDVILDAHDNETHHHPLEKSKRIIAIGSSTGGTDAIEHLLKELPPLVLPPIVVVQHMPEQFTRAFAERLNSTTAHQVKEAQDGETLNHGTVYIAKGGVHLLVRSENGQYLLELKDGPLVSRHKPSVDVLFRSVTKVAGQNALGIILTGMGDDGAQGMLELFKAGAVTFAQDEQSSLVFGMPKEAIAKGGVTKVLSLEMIPLHIRKLAGEL